LQSELDTCNGELVYLNIALCDENLVTDTANDCKLHLTVEGNAVLLGFGSGNPKSRYAYTQADTETFQGRAMAILKKWSEEVDTKVTISSGTGLTASCFV
jgi:beta-galactosidase